MHNNFKVSRKNRAAVPKTAASQKLISTMADKRLHLYVQLAKLEGLSLSVFPDSQGIFVKTFLTPAGSPAAEKSGLYISEPYDFTEEAWTFLIEKTVYTMTILTLAIYAQGRPMSQLVCWLNVPVHICPSNHIIESKFMFTVERVHNQVLDLVKGTLKLHLDKKGKARPFAAARKKVRMEILKDFAKHQTSNGKLTISTIKPDLATIAPTVVRGVPAAKSQFDTSQTQMPPAQGAFQLPPPPPNFAGSGPTPPPVEVAPPPPKPRRGPQPQRYAVPALVLQSIETAIATAPQEMWSYFADWDFLVEGLQFFRVPNPPDP
jgi:hypothetical protein